MEIERRYPEQLGEFDRVSLILVGCGGTGSYLVRDLASLAYHARQRRGLDVMISLVDPDTVEERNCGRQNFCPAEIGANKAETLARRHNLAFGLDIEAFPEPFNGEFLQPRSNRTLLIGAVDNAAARSEIDQAVRGFRGTVLWLDAGNHEHAGQILLGNREDLEAPEISPLGFCTGLPLPSIQAPELLTPRPAPAADSLSCAEMTAVDAQGLVVNRAVASFAAHYVSRLLISRDLDIYATFFDLTGGSARSLGITKA